ncbi:MAG: archaellin/type IV pilin N-terminal domain-containing protein, partial [Methanoregula sp.]
MKSSTQNDEGFTGLEAAIVLIAFVVVAAVFSYVVLGAGFFTTQKAQETVHTGVAQATSAVELSGPVMVQANSAGN